jgi:steroid delta-isomerase-like uncharacterized protein
MAQKDNVELSKSLYELWNAREFEQLAKLIADDGEIVIVGSGTSFRGPDGSIEFSRMWANGFPDGKVKIERTIASGNTVVLQFTGKGTHTGTLRGPGGDIPATGRSITLQLCDVHDIRDGKIKKLSTYFDSASLLQQLGVMPEAQVAAKA